MAHPFIPAPPNQRFHLCDIEVCARSGMVVVFQHSSNAMLRETKPFVSDAGFAIDFTPNVSLKVGPDFLQLSASDEFAYTRICYQYTGNIGKDSREFAATITNAMELFAIHNHLLLSRVGDQIRFFLTSEPELLRTSEAQVPTAASIAGD